MSSLNVHAVIMAGGSGTRFWPLSRKKTPKQFLPITGDMTMFEETVARLLPFVPYKRIYSVSNGEQAAVIRRLTPRLPGKNVLVEPAGKNTAPSLLLATAQVYLQDPEAVVAALPADHLIRDVPRFLKKLEAGAEVASQGDFLVTFGIPATYPATGYGYIHFSGKTFRRVRGEKFSPVLEFKEKPAYESAKKFLEDGNHYWNSGMFLWRADVFSRKLEEYAPSFHPYWERILAVLKKKSRSGLARIFNEIPSLSIDYALMEKAQGVLVCKGDFGWSDVGSWSSLADIWTRDGNKNSSKGETAAVEAQNCLVYNPGKLTALVGIKDIIVVAAGDALLICHKDYDQKVKEIIDALSRKGRLEFL